VTATLLEAQRPSVCPSPADAGTLGVSVVAPGDVPSGSTGAAAAAAAQPERPGGRELPERSGVLATGFTEVAEAAVSLHPLFYVLLVLSIAALSAAALPATAFPNATVGAALARRRAEVTLAGIVALIAVLMAYLLALD
jgi:hypothetical protein